MKSAAQQRRNSRLVRKKRIRKQISGTDQKPRLCVFKSLRFTYAQLVSDQTGKVIAAASTRGLASKSMKTVETAKQLGIKIAELAQEKSIKEVVFDRSGYSFHGRVAAVAYGAREAGLQF